MHQECFHGRGGEEAVLIHDVFRGEFQYGPLERLEDVEDADLPPQVDVAMVHDLPFGPLYGGHGDLEGRYIPAVIGEVMRLVDHHDKIFKGTLHGLYEDPP